MKRALVIGVGGLGSPVALLLARAGIPLTLLDDDRVEETNLHRQILFRPEDIGEEKVEVAAARLRAEGADVVARRGRFLPTTAKALAAEHALVVEGADNFATKFLAADACALTGTPLVQAGAVRWSGWALSVRPGESACLRCLFEDVPRGRVDTCAITGVIGPVVGAIGALEATLAIRLWEGGTGGELYAYEGLEGRIRHRRLARRPGCPACAGEIAGLGLGPERYASVEHAP